MGLEHGEQGGLAGGWLQEHLEGLHVEAAAPWDEGATGSSWSQAGLLDA